jgi:hypothetical protein
MPGILSRNTPGSAKTDASADAVCRPDGAGITNARSPNTHGQPMRSVMRDHEPIGHMSGKVTVRVRVSRGEHVKPLVVECRVVRRHGRDQNGNYHATVIHEGREIEVMHSMVRGIWQPVRPLR